MADKTIPAQARTAEDILLDDRSANSSLLICTIHENQRPLKGVAAELDWRLRGFLSRFVISGRIKGQKNECVYIPIKRHNSLRHLLLVGLGPKDAAKSDPSESVLKTLAKTVHDLKFTNVALSRSSFPFFTDAAVKKAFKGVEVEFIQ